jgi:hypothetical protein
MNLYQQLADLAANISRNLLAAVRSDISSLIVRWSSRMGLIAAIALAILPALGRDVDGRYKESPLHDWFEHLASGKGLCCSYADCYVIQDADWESEDGHYRVRVPNAPSSENLVWVDVPDEAIITEPNKAGRTMVWPLYSFGRVSIRCFMPGSMT